MEDSHNIALGILSGLPTWTTLALISSAEVPMWLYVLTAIVLPLVIGFGGKVVDILYSEYKERRALRKKILNLDE